MTDDLNMTRARGFARDIETFANLRGWALPIERTQAAQVVEAARQATRQLPVPAPMPTDPKKVAAWVTAEAARRVAFREAEVVARELVETAERLAVKVAIDEVPTLATKLIAEFGDTIASFANLVRTAPHEITSNTTADEFSQHASLLRTVDELSTAASIRRRFAEILGEELEDPAWLVLDLKPSTTIAKVLELLRDLRGAMPGSLEEWRRVVEAGASMAGHEGAMTRAATFSGVVYDNGLRSPDGGKLDKTLAEAGLYSEGRPTMTDFPNERY